MIRYLVLIHLLCCLACYLWKRSRSTSRESLLMFMVLFIPVFGMILFLIEDVAIRKSWMGEKEVGLEKLRIQDAKYRRIQIDSGENNSITVPLEEAMLINDTNTRRKLMMDLLHRNPEENVDLLQKTRMASDTEITHYATTTMMEIQSGFELSIQKCAMKAKCHPNEKAFQEGLYIELKKYIASGLISGNVLAIYQEQLEEVLRKLRKLDPESKEYQFEMIDVLLEMKKYEEASALLQTAKGMWPMEERIYQLYVKYYYSSGSGDKIATVLEEIKAKNIYLTQEGKRWFAFWNQEEA